MPPSVVGGSGDDALAREVAMVALTVRPGTDSNSSRLQRRTQPLASTLNTAALAMTGYRDTRSDLDLGLIRSGKTTS